MALGPVAIVGCCWRIGAQRHSRIAMMGVAASVMVLNRRSDAGFGVQIGRGLYQPPLVDNLWSMTTGTNDQLQRNTQLAAIMPCGREPKRLSRHEKKGGTLRINIEGTNESDWKS